MKKQKYSLTAKERRALRNKNTINEQNEKSPGEETETAISAPKSKMPRKNFILSVFGIILGVMLLLTAVILPLSCSRYFNIKAPVARMELSNGMVLEFELYEESCPIAATNFIFLARNRFFDNTIIFDVQQNWVRFGNYETPTTVRSSNEAYCEEIEGFNKGHLDNKFGYRLQEDSSSDAKRFIEEGMLTFNFRQSSNEFFIAGANNCQTTLDNTNYAPTAFGRYLNDKTLENIKAISQMTFDTSSPHNTWKAPVPAIVIKTVRVYNLDNKKWKKFHFETYMNQMGPDKTSVITGWYGK